MKKYFACHVFDDDDPEINHNEKNSFEINIKNNLVRFTELPQNPNNHNGLYFGEEELVGSAYFYNCIGSHVYNFLENKKEIIKIRHPLLGSLINKFPNNADILYFVKEVEENDMNYCQKNVYVYNLSNDDVMYLKLLQ